MPRSESAELIWITPKWPLPAQDGARIATAALIRPLCAMGAKVHLRSWVTPDDVPDASAARAELGVQSVEWTRKGPRTPLNPRLPLTFASYSGPKLRAQAERWNRDLAHLKNAAWVFDGLHAAGPWKWAPEGHVIYRAHNVESRIWQGAAYSRNDPFSRTFLLFQSRRVAAIERAFVRSSLLTCAVSEVDAGRFREEVPGATIESVPIGFSAGSKAQQRNPHPNELLFVGRLDWRPNRQGLQWFINTVWPQVIRRSPHSTLTIAGSGDGTWLGHYSSLSGINVLGRVNELAPLYARASAAIIPIFYGSGTRVKAIEASLHGCPCISTALGIEGTGLVEKTSYTRAESASEWIDAVLAAGSSRTGEIARSALSFALRSHDPIVAAETFLESFFRARASKP